MNRYSGFENSATFSSEGRGRGREIAGERNVKFRNKEGIAR